MLSPSYVSRFILFVQGKENSPFLLMPKHDGLYSGHLAPETSLFLPLAGYTVTSVVSSKQGRVYVAGAPRFNHTGKVILFTMHNNRSLTIHQALRGEQVIEGWLQGSGSGQRLGSDQGRVGKGAFPSQQEGPTPPVQGHSSNFPCD